MLTSINGATLLSESRHAPHRKCESAIHWMGITHAEVSSRGESLLKKAGEGLGRAAASATQKGVQQGIGKLAEVGAEKIAEILRSLF